MRRARRRWRGHAPALHGLEELVDFGGEARVVSERAAVVAVVVGEVVGVTADGGADRGEGAPRGASQQPGCEQPCVRHGGWGVRSDGGGGEARNVDAGVGADVRDNTVGDQRVDRVEVVALGQVSLCVQAGGEPVVERRARLGGRGDE